MDQVSERQRDIWEILICENLQNVNILWGLTYTTPDTRLTSPQPHPGKPGVV